MKITKLNESFSLVDADKDTLLKAYEFLKVEIPNAYFDKMVKIGLKSRWHYFMKINHGHGIIYSGIAHTLKNFNPEMIGFDKCNELSSEEVDEYIKTLNLPFEPYDYQKENIRLALSNYKMIFRSCTSSGKSLTISLILEYFRRKGMKGILVVPNVNLLTQFLSDIKSYGLNELYSQTQLFGDGNTSDFKSALTITTWQSMMKEVPNIDNIQIDFIICDEAHRMASDCTSDIILKSMKTKIKLGFTGTLPEDPVAKMTLIGLFGLPKTIITASQLIDRGLATPVIIKPLILNYPYNEKIKFRDLSNYQEQLKFIKEYKPRTNILVKISVDVFTKSKNCLVLFQHTEHGKEIFKDIVKKIYDIDADESDIVGRNSMEFQKKYKVLFMNGEQSGKTREEQRQFMEENKGVILVGNYACMSTGINIKNLHLLILASPLKAFTTISQSLGRLMRKHKDKTESIVVDVVDNFGFRKPSGIFYKQYQHRLSASYIPEEFEIKECSVDV